MVVGIVLILKQFVGSRLIGRLILFLNVGFISYVTPFGSALIIWNIWMTLRAYIDQSLCVIALEILLDC